MTKKINGEIELLRFVFAMIVVLRHSRNLMDDSFLYFEKASFGVEFFFLVTGFLLMKSVEKINLSQGKMTGLEVWIFIKKKISGFYVELVLAAIIGWCFILLSSDYSSARLLQTFLESIPRDFLLLFATGFTRVGVNAPIWYLSSMLLAILIYYPLLRRITPNIRVIVIPVTSLVLLGYLFQTNNSLFGPTTWLTFTYVGNIRAFAEIGLGIWGYDIIKYFQSLEISPVSLIIMTCAKLVGYGIVLGWAILGSTNDYMPHCFIILWSCVMLSFSQRCVDTGIYSSKLCMFLGKISMPMYLVHFYFASGKKGLASLNNVEAVNAMGAMKIVILCSISVLLAIVIYYLGQRIRLRFKL